jgi:hypothetical protein
MKIKKSLKITKKIKMLWHIFQDKSKKQYKTIRALFSKNLFNNLNLTNKINRKINNKSLNNRAQRNRNRLTNKK